MKLVNLTAHDITVWREEQPILRLPRSGRTARLTESETREQPLTVDGVGVPLTAARHTGAVSGPPDAEPGVGLVVSRALATAVRRQDPLFPWGEVSTSARRERSGCRGESGLIIGGRALARFVHEAHGAGQEHHSRARFEGEA